MVLELPSNEDRTGRTITILFAFPIGVGASIYLEEYARENLINRIIQTNINNMAGVPSIIYGMLGLAIFVRVLEPITSGSLIGVVDPTTANGRTILSAGLTLGLLILPLMGGLVLLYRRFAVVKREGEDLEKVYAFARQVEQIGPDEDGPRRLVEAIRELLNAERVALWLPPYLDEEPRLIVAADDGREWYDGPTDPDDLFRRRATEGPHDGPVLVSLGAVAAFIVLSVLASLVWPEKAKEADRGAA